MSRSPAFDAFVSNTLGVIGHPVPEAYIEGLHGLTRGRVKVNATSIRGYLTQYRWIELSNEADAVVSAWAVAPMQAFGKIVNTVVLIGDMHTPQEIVRMMAKASAGVAEVIVGGSKVSTLLGEGVTPDGHRTFLYALPGIDRKHADKRLATFAIRNEIELVAVDKVGKKAGKAKAA
jgi:hypothetical protein